MKNEKSEFSCDLHIADKIETEELFGIAYVQIVSKQEGYVGSQPIEYSVKPVGPRVWKQARAYREMLRRAGSKVPKIERHALRDELIIISGASMSSADVAHALRVLIREIEENGMWIGKYKDEYLLEKTNGN